MKRVLTGLLLLAGCGTGGDKEDSGTSAVDGWASILADQVPGGIFLSGYDTGDGLTLVGGNLRSDVGNLGHYANGGLCVETAVTDGALWWIDGEGSEFYAVGSHGVILHERDGVRTREDVDTEASLFGVWVDGESVWAVGGNTNTLAGEIWRKEAGEWTLFQSGLPGLLFKIWDGWIVGDGLAYFWDGTELIDRSPPNGERLLTMKGTSVDDAWAVGGLAGPVLLHWVDGGWQTPEIDTTCLRFPLAGVAVDADTVWVAGHNGTVTSMTDGAWTCDAPPVTQEHFHGVFQYGDQVLWLGGNLLSAADSYGTLAVHPASAPLSEVPECP